MTYAELFGKLREYEMDLTRMYEDGCRKNKIKKRKQDNSLLEPLTLS